MYEKGVSICITAYKADKFIKECLDSVMNQTWFKTHDNWEIIVGVDGCARTLHYLQSIMGNYKNLRVLMMDSNKGTYVTTNTIMKEAKYSGLIRFDSDDKMLPIMVQRILEEKKDNDLIYFRMQNFGNNTARNSSCGQVYIRHEVFDKFGGYRPWVCSADLELQKRLKKFVKVKKIREVLFNRRIHNANLTVDKKTNFTSPIRLSINQTIEREKFNFEKEAIIECVTNTFKEIFPDTDISCYKIEDEFKVENNEVKSCNRKVSAIRAKKRKALHRRVNYKYHVLS